MLEEIFEDDLLGDPNDLEEIIEQQAEENEDDLQAQEVEANAENNDDAGNENANANGTRVDPTKKRTVRNPQPKLNPERLKGPRGIAILEDNFKDFKFHGKGYECVDLNRVMKRLEHWAHRLFPRFQFDDCLEKIEKLGQKKPVQVYVKKIRMGLEIGEEPVILHDDDDDEDEQNDPLQAAYNAPPDAFDELIGQQLSQAQANQSSVPGTPLQARSPSPPSIQAKTLELTAEQKERIIKNRLLAEERRLARMKAKREMEKAEQEPSTSVLCINNTNLTDHQISNNFAHSDTIDVPKSLALKESNVTPKTSENQDNISSSNSSHKCNTPSIKESGLMSPLTFIEQDCPTNIVKENNTLNSANTEQNKPIQCPDDLEQNLLEPVLNDKKHNELTAKLTENNIQNDTTEQINSLAIPTNSKQNLIPSLNLAKEENNLISMPDTPQNNSIPMSVDEEQNISPSILPNEELSFELIVNDQENNSIFVSDDKNQSKTLCMKIDTDQNNSNSMVIDNDQDNVSKFVETPLNNVISMQVDNNEVNESTCMSVDAEHNSPTSMSVDNEHSNSIPMSVDCEQSNSATLLLENEQIVSKDEQNYSNEQTVAQENIISNVLQPNDNAILDISEEM